jgi:hypothetical protein
VKQILEQRMPAWEPTHWPPFYIGLFFTMAVVLLPIGIGMYFTTIQAVVVETRYENSCNMTANEFGAPYCNTTVYLNIPRRMEPPIYMYYKLYSFYQNYRKYAKSRYDEQLSGVANIPISSFSQACDQFLYYNHGWDNQSYNSAYNNEANVYMPCGTIAWSMFNDSFILSKPSGGVVCDGINYAGTNCTKKGIADIADIQRFKRGASGRNFTTQYYNEAGHYLPDILDEDFMVWMRTSAMSNFRKLYRIINVPLDPGNYTIFVQNRYPVTKFGGGKSVILSTYTWIGGDNLTFSIMNMAVGGTAFLVASAFTSFTIQFIVKRIRDSNVS